jgi:ornithine cyclodeaminase/alanine dehydrogenase-like protein (mu-crystallin family)
MELLVLTAAEVRQAIRVQAAINIMKTAFRDLSTGIAQAPLRSNISIGGSNGKAFYQKLET